MGGGEAQGTELKGREMALVWLEKARRTALQTISILHTQTLWVQTHNTTTSVKEIAEKRRLRCFTIFYYILLYSTMFYYILLCFTRLQTQRIEYILEGNLLEKSVKWPFCCTVSILQVYFIYLCYIIFWALEYYFIENLKLLLKE